MAAKVKLKAKVTYNKEENVSNFKNNFSYKIDLRKAKEKPKDYLWTVGNSLIEQYKNQPQVENVSVEGSIEYNGEIIKFEGNDNKLEEE